MRPEIDLHAFAAAQADGAFVLDVREPGEYVDGHVPGARLVPLAQVLAGHVPARRAEYPAGEPVFVICASGNRSRSAADRLRSSGVEAVSVAGGTQGWIAQGRPVVRGPHAAESAT